MCAPLVRLGVLCPVLAVRDASIVRQGMSVELGPLRHLYALLVFTPEPKLMRVFSVRTKRFPRIPEAHRVLTAPTTSTWDPQTTIHTASAMRGSLLCSVYN